jgi:hypothetical protein
MNRPGLVLLLAVLSLGILCRDASACINDRTTVVAEKEFKSSYIDRRFKPGSRGPSSTQPAGSNRLVLLSLAGVGVAALVAAFFVTAGRPRRPSA